MAEHDPADLSIFLPRDINIPGSCHEKGRGSYGSVCELKIHGVRCVAKTIHKVLQDGTENTVSVKFRRECEVLNRLRHPNIVQCLGIYKGSMGNNHIGDMSIVMEYMHMDLDHCLSKYPNIILPIKLSVLRDVSHGLLHLHSQKPPIIHRDLTASNILLTPDMRAKIADLGVSRMFELKEVLPALTLAPGTLAYMPLEALTERPNYDLKLDIFSFGVVALYTGNQKLPIAFEVTDIPKDVCERKELQLLKRRRWMEELGSAHPLYQLITKCLKDNPDSRPVTSELCSDVEKLCHEYLWEFENILKVKHRILLV